MEIDISFDDKSLFKLFTDRVEIIGIDFSNKYFIDHIISFRIKYKVKLPDSIILSSAFIHNADLISADKQFKQVTDIRIIDFKY